VQNIRINMEYFINPENGSYYGYDPVEQEELIAAAVANGWQRTDGPAPPPVPTAALNKSIASSLLASTDWTTVADVSDSTKSNPYLTNLDEFVSYRNELRKIAVNPVEGTVTFPVKPSAQWSS
jgi:hypothetical protein